MGARERTSLAPLLAIYLPFCSLNTLLTVAVDTISAGHSLSGNQTIVSNEGNFELGFFTPGDSLNYYIGIWYKKVPKQTVIWVANRATPISSTHSSELKLAPDGNLVLQNQSKTPVWSSNSILSASNSTVAVLLDTGNLVLKDGSSSVILWQSFDHPTDTWVPGSKLGLNKITGEYQIATSWVNSKDPAPGLFSLRIDPGGSPQFFMMWNGSERYWSTGLWDGNAFSLIPEMIKNSKFYYTFVDNNQRRYFSYNVYNNSIITRTVVDSSGKMNQFIWSDSTQVWILVWSQPVVQCNVYSLCGAFGVCNQNSVPFCSCLQGFQPASLMEWDLNDWAIGCERKNPLGCSNNSTSGEEDSFLEVPNVHLPANPQSPTAQSAQQCKMACLKSCNCTAYAYANECSTWNGDLRNLRQSNVGDAGSGTLYLRLAASAQPSHSSNKTRVIWVATGSVVGVVAILCIVLGLRKQRLNGMPKTVQQAMKYFSKKLGNGGPDSVVDCLVFFWYADLRSATKNFCEKLGDGRSGSVFKGTLPDSTTIAVKKLEGLKQGEKQFRAEVSTLGMIQHVNLVRLRGFCSEGVRKLLVYDYMPNGSLDSHLFGDGSKVLGWKTRYQIILGTARGLTYLHESCRERIIHCDIKPENILLDAELRPKIADFGMAKLLGRDFSRVLTTTKGTVGYLAPEWILGVPITPKADVYSFGMVLFELISGKRNFESSESGDARFFPTWAAARIAEGEVLGLVDQKLGDDVDEEEVSRACKVACWCIQDSELNRPSMREIVRIFEGALVVDTPPVPRLLLNLIEDSSSLLKITHWTT